MGFFDYGDPTDRRPGCLAESWPGRSGAGCVVGTECEAAVKPVPSTATDGGPRVLVVDDNPVNRMLASELLACWGIRPLLAVDGSEAVALACQLPLELILMDLQMPVLDGLGATRQIRRFELERARAPVAIVAYTSADVAGDRLRLQHCGLDGVLPKPCAAHELHACLSRWCPTTTVPAALADPRDEHRMRLAAVTRP